MDDPIRATSKPERSARRRKTRDDERACENCGTILSKYNLDDGFCFRHQSRSYRFTVRGR